MTHEEEMQEKKKFVEGVDQALSGRRRISVDSVNYEVYESEEFGIIEFIVVTYNGGAIAPRNVTGDSEGAIFQEIAKLIFGGYYDELWAYRKIKEISQKII